MIHFLEQKLFLPQQLVLFALQGTTLGDIFDRQQQSCTAVALIEYLASIQQHRPLADRRKDALDLIFLARRVVRDDVLKECTQRRNVPLAVAQLIEQMTLSFFWGHIECAVERSACDNNAKRIVEHDKGLARGATIS